MATNTKFGALVDMVHILIKELGPESGKEISAASGEKYHASMDILGPGIPETTSSDIIKSKRTMDQFNAADKYEFEDQPRAIAGEK